ncbi:uncharacterized protein [Typha angustifolia]|uniref:uncharacterized protein isoform X2 n=1 Tax=Typha angustifolia TaxID=59011 RepID=UPI003C2DDD45
MRSEGQQSRLIYELCALLFTILRSPTESPPPLPPPPGRRSRSSMRASHVSPAGFASLLLGVSLALMLCGSVTFVVGFILMPWVIGLVMFFYFVGIVSYLSGMGRAFLCPSPPSSPKEKETSDMDYMSSSSHRRVCGKGDMFIGSIYQVIFPWEVMKNSSFPS